MKLQLSCKPSVARTCQLTVRQRGRPAFPRASSGNPGGQPEVMTISEAYAVLGVPATASFEEVGPEGPKPCCRELGPGVSPSAASLQVVAAKNKLLSQRASEHSDKARSEAHEVEAAYDILFMQASSGWGTGLVH